MDMEELKRRAAEARKRLGLSDDPEEVALGVRRWHDERDGT